MSSDEKSGSQRAIKRPQVPPGPLAELKALLYQLYQEAGPPTMYEIAAWIAADENEDLAAAPGRATVARIIGSATMPPSQANLVTVVTVLARAARWDSGDAAQRARDLWVEARMDSARTPAGGVRVSEADPRRLGVHAAISVPGVADEVLPEYVPRDADDGELGVWAKVAAAAKRGGFVLLIGGSSVGKTRCAFEAVAALLPDWWLAHPAGPTEVAALAKVPTARTVVWLDELQRHLDGEHGLTGGVVRALLNPPHPAVIIGTLWPDRYTTYTTPPIPGGADPHAGEREVLDLANVVRIDSEFSPAEQGRARVAAAKDPRLAVALEATGYGMPQTLAAAPQLVARWEDAQTANPYARAVLTAALDVARLGARAPLGIDLLRAAAPGYCTRVQQAEAPENWFEQSLAYATGKLHGAATALRPAGTGMGQIDGYTVADYLLQHVSRERRTARIPASFWDALVGHIGDPADAARLADSASNRLLYRYAIPLYRYAAGAGDGHAAERLADLLADRGDLDEAVQILRARTRADAGDGHAAERLAERLAGLLAGRGDLDELRARADAGNWAAASRLARLLADRGDLDEAVQILRARADAGDGRAVWQLVGLLADRGDLDELRARADGGDGHAASRLGRLLADRGDLDELRARAAAGDENAAELLLGLLVQRGDLDELRARADAGDKNAARGLAGLLADRGDLDELRARADAGDGDAAVWLGDLLAGRGDLDELRARAAAGDRYAAWRLADLARRGDLDELRARAAAGDKNAAVWLADLLADRGDLDELRARADGGDGHAASRLGRLLAGRGDLDELRARAAAGDRDAARGLAGLLAGRGDLDELRARADAGDESAAWRLVGLLAGRGDLDELRARAGAGDKSAAWRLVDLLEKQGCGEEAERLRRFGLNPDGSIAWA